MTANVQKQSEYMGMTIPAGVLARVFGTSAEGVGAQGGIAEAVAFLLALPPEQMWEVAIRRPKAVCRILQEAAPDRRVALLAAPKVLHALSMSLAANDVWAMVENLDDDAKVRVLRADGAMKAALGDTLHTQRFFAFVHRLNDAGRHDDAARILHSDKGVSMLFLIGREHDLAQVIVALPNSGAKEKLLGLYRAVRQDFAEMTAPAACLHP